MKNGFTLIEMLIVIAVLSVVTVLVLVIFTRNLRANNKSQIVLSIKHNGQAALETIDKTIRNSYGIACPTSPGVSQSIAIRTGDGQYSRFRISNGAILQDYPEKQLAQTQQQFEAQLCDMSDPIQTASAITDTNPLTGVYLKSGSFEKIANPEGKKFKDVW